MELGQIIITIASVITALGVIFGVIFAVYKMVLETRKTRQRYQGDKGGANPFDLWCPRLLKRPKRARLLMDL